VKLSHKIVVDVASQNASELDNFGKVGRRVSLNSRRSFSFGALCFRLIRAILMPDNIADVTLSESSLFEILPRSMMPSISVIVQPFKQRLAHVTEHIGCINSIPGRICAFFEEGCVT
jgi:hypothetical protein